MTLAISFHVICLPIIVLIALGEIITLGLVRAFDFFWIQWFKLLVSCYWAFAGILLLIIFLESFALIDEALAPRIQLWNKVIKLLKAAIETIWTIFCILIVLALVMGVGAKFAASKQTPLRAINAADIPNVAKIQNQQIDAMDDLTTSAKTLLQSLDGTQQEIEKAKEDLRGTVETLAKQEHLANAARAQVEQIAIEQEDLKEVASKAETIVGSEHLITRSDLEQANREGEMRGLMWSIPFGLIPIFLWETGKKLYARWRSQRAI